MKYYYTIGEVSNLLGVEPHVLRYWETEFTFIKPRQEKGRIRRYTVEQIELLRRIQDMLHNQRYTIEGARQKLRAERRASRSKAKQPSPALFTSDPRIRTQMQELKTQLQQIIETCEKIQRKQ
ncbi:MAG: MerR family transcriptional regulator [Candidatus Cloacimonetes bacterium]|nr:MerR family transcriptional regulator [Candidatus Cloacimonadota bacterium]